MALGAPGVLAGLRGTRVVARARRDYFIEVPDDGLATNEVGPWAEDKYRYVGMYAEIFSTGMKKAWDKRVYLDLFSGPGSSKVRGKNRVVLGSPMIALNVPDRFDSYVFADENAQKLDALKVRVGAMEPPPDVTYIQGDANNVVDRVTAAIPATHRKTLSFCFLDPYNLDIHFETVRKLATDRAMDFLILLALYVDANRNLSTYINEQSQTIDRLLGDPRWRDAWRVAEAAREPFVPFLASEYSTRMQTLGYLPVGLADMVKIHTYEKHLPLYYLAFFSRDKTGLRLWKQVLKYANDQLTLGL